MSISKIDINGTQHELIASGLTDTSAEKVKLNATNVAYGTCATAADVAAKVVTLAGNTNWKLATGSIVTVKFTATNTAASPTLNVNGTGAYPIYYNNAEYTSSSSYGGYANRHITYQFDGAYWVFISWSYDTNSDTKVQQNAAIITAGEYPVILAYSTATSKVTNAVQKTTTLKYNPSTKILTAPTFNGNLTGTATEATHAASADEADHATSADTATNATSAGSATEATHAASADEADHATSADTATNATSAGSATKATQDASGNVITSTYETKTDATAKLAEAKTYADGVKNSLLNGAGAAYDTLSELATLIDENTDAIDALETVATGKADKTHDHTITASASDDDVVVLTGTNGTNKVTYSASHANSGVTAGTYRSVTVNAKGHVTAGTNPTTLAGYGITDVYTKAEVDAAIAAAIAAALNVDTTTEV